MGPEPTTHSSQGKLLGGLPFVSRTFEGGFEESPYVLDMDANLYIGPADQVSRDEHSAIEVVFHFLRQTGKVSGGFRDLLRDRRALLDAFAALDDARSPKVSEFRIHVFGTYDGELLEPGKDDELPAGPCGLTVNDIRRRFYRLCRRIDTEFEERDLDERQREMDARLGAD